VQGHVNNVLGGMSAAQLFDVMSQLRVLISQNGAQARQTLISNPQLTKALFQAQIMLGMVKPPPPPAGAPAAVPAPVPAHLQQPPPGQSSQCRNNSLACYNDVINRGHRGCKCISHLLPIFMQDQQSSLQALGTEHLGPSRLHTRHLAGTQYSQGKWWSR
jgi:hypothetical protein